MYTSAFVLICLTFSGQGRRVQREVPQHPDHLNEDQLTRHDAKDRSLQSLAKILHASGATAGFQATGIGHSRVLGLSTTRTSQPIHGQRAGKSVLFANPFSTADSKLEPEEEVDEFISDELQENFNEASYLFMRVAVAAVMIHHGQEKILSAEMFTKFAIDKYFAFLPGPHIYWTYIVGYIQYLAPFFMALGIFSRAAGASLAGVMTGAFLQSVLQSGLEQFPKFELAGLNQKLKYGIPIFHNYGFEVPLLYVAIFALVAVNGPGKFSIAQLIGWNDDKSLLGKLKQ
jgi:uncharacterized membrane protein YphA (DoxX/SURF4 family)